MGSVRTRKNPSGSTRYYVTFIDEHGVRRMRRAYGCNSYEEAQRLLDQIEGRVQRVELGVDRNDQGIVDSLRLLHGKINVLQDTLDAVLIHLGLTNDQ